MNLIDHFGLLAPYYDRLIQLREPGQLIAVAGLPVEGRVLDAGGGTGRVAQHLLGFAGQVVVVDLSEEMLRQAVQKTGLRLALAPAELLPFPEGTFDRVFMVDAFHHVLDQPRTAWELWRVLKPGGRLVIEEPDIRTLPVKFIAVAEKLALMRSHFMPAEKIAGLFGFPGARIEIFRKGYNAWIFVEKKG